MRLPRYHHPNFHGIFKEISHQENQNMGPTACLARHWWRNLGNIFNKSRMKVYPSILLWVIWKKKPTFLWYFHGIFTWSHIFQVLKWTKTRSRGSAAYRPLHHRQVPGIGYVHMYMHIGCLLHTYIHAYIDTYIHTICMYMCTYPIPGTWRWCSGL
jgi:hypothetical protein